MLTIKCLFKQICFELSAKFHVSVCEPERWCKTVPYYWVVHTADTENIRQSCLVRVGGVNNL